MRRGSIGRGARRLAALLATMVVAVLLPALPAAAHGSDDQASGPPTEACSTAAYPGSKLITTGESRQSFVPSRGGLASVELCIQNLVGLPGTDFTVHVYEGDNPAAPGALLASQPVDAGLSLLAAQWLHVDLDVPGGEVPTTPGASYVIGVEPVGGLLSTVSFQWRSTCNDGLLSSCSGVPDAYPQGRTNDLPGNADYGFRARPLEDADLVGTVDVAPLVCPGLDLSGATVGTVQNLGATSVAPFDTEWLWSADPLLDAGDTVISGSRHTVPGLGAGATAPIPGPVVPADVPAGEGHLLLHVDVDGAVVESDETGNVAAGPTTVTTCGQPEITGLDLSVVEEEIQAGFGEIQFDDLDPGALSTLPQSPAEVAASPAFSANGFSPNGFSANGFSPNEFSANGFSANGFSANGFSANGFSANGFSANGFSANGFSANGFSPAGSILLADILDDLPAGLADVIHVVNIPVVGDGWETRLAGLTDRPIQNITLAEASALLPTLRMDEVDLRRSLTLSWLATALANGILDDTPVDGGWCAFIAAHGSTCEGLGVDPATTSLVGLEGSGFPAHQAPIASLPLSAIDRGAAFAVMDLPLTGDRRFNLELTRLGQQVVEAALVPEQTLVDCAAFACSRTLAEAAAEGAFAAGDVRALLSQLSPAGLDAGLVGDLAMGTASVDTLRLSAANWNMADIPQVDPACPPAGYRLTGANTGDGAAVDPTATVTLPPGFGYVPGSVALVADGVGAPAQTDPSVAVGPDGARTLTFELDGSFAESFELSFAACANLYLGTFEAGSATVSGSGIDGAYTASTASPDTVQVVERTPGVTTRPVVSEDNVVIADHISAANAHDSWTFDLKPEPGTLYIAKLFTPVGTDLDLIAYGPEFSANGFSANGFSANGFSANGFSANGFSANGFSANGFSANGFSANGFSANGFSDTAPPDLSDDVPIEELRPADSSGQTVSANRWDTSEAVYLVSRPGDAGRFTFSVADYNGTRSDAPYFLTIQTVRSEIDPRLAECQSAPWDLSRPAGSPPAPWSGSEGPRTLFLTNRQVTASAHGDAEAAAGIAALSELAARPEVRGIVVEVDHDIDVRAAYGAWRNDWCNPTAANVVASSIRDLVLELRRQHATIDTVVIAGDDALVPDFRLNDGSALANEQHYTEALLKATGGNDPLVSTFAHGMIPSADPYGNEAPLPFGTTYAFPPSAGVSRLVETPADWIAQKDLYVLSDGALEPQAGFVSAYDGMVDGAQAAAAALEGAGLPTDVLTDEATSWTADDFRAGAFTADRTASGWNGHANHWALLSDRGSETDDSTEVVTTGELAQLGAGTLVFSNGCHFGTAVSDLLNDAPTEAERQRLADWAQGITGRQGVAIANSGFGIFDTTEVGQGERLQQYLLEEMDRSANVSLALAKAKNRFFASPGVYDAYTYKTLQQLQVYGLGIFRMFGTTTEEPPPPPPAAAPADRIDVAVGPLAVDPTGTSSCTDCYRLEETADGTRVELRSTGSETGHTSSNGYWSAPLSSTAVPLPSGMAPAGLWIDHVDSVELPDVDPVITRLGVDDPAREVEVQAAAPFPTAFGMVNAVAGQAHVTLLHGMFEPERTVNGKVEGDVHLYTEIDADLLLMPATEVGCTPHIDEVTVVRSTDDTLVLVDVLAGERCGPNARAAALARDSEGNWHSVELAQGAGGHWSGGFTISPDATVEDLHVQVSNGRGVGHWRHKGDRPILNEGSIDGLELLVSGEQHGSGVYLGGVDVTILGADGVQYQVYDNDHLLGTFADGETIAVSGDGAHEIVISGSDGSTAATTVAIDGTAPTIVWLSPPDDAQYAVDEVDTVDVRCADPGTGATCVIEIDEQPVANGSPLPTGGAGGHTIVVTATDGVGRQTTASRTYTVLSGYVIGPFESPVVNPPSVNRVNRGSQIPLKFEVHDHEGNEYRDPSIIAARTWQPIDCRKKTTIGAAFPAQGTQPEYSGSFHFNVDAPTTKACFELAVVMDDGTRRTAWFDVR